MGSSPGAMVYCYDENGVRLVSGDDKIDHDEQFREINNILSP